MQELSSLGYTTGYCILCSCSGNKYIISFSAGVEYYYYFCSPSSWLSPSHLVVVRLHTILLLLHIIQVGTHWLMLDQTMDYYYWWWKCNRLLYVVCAREIITKIYFEKKRYKKCTQNSKNKVLTYPSLRILIPKTRKCYSTVRQSGSMVPVLNCPPAL